MNVFKMNVLVSNLSVIPIRWILTVDSEIDLLMQLTLKKTSRFVRYRFFAGNIRQGFLHRIRPTQVKRKILIRADLSFACLFEESLRLKKAISLMFSCFGVFGDN